MANPEHVAILQQGVAVWNAWYAEHPEVNADLGQVHLSHADLRQLNLTDANLAKAYLRRTNLNYAKLQGANLQGAMLKGVNLGGANLRGTDLSKANLIQTYLVGADLSQADLRGADLSAATLIETNLTQANLTGCRVYGVSAWDLNLEGSIQKNLVISPRGEPTVQVDRLDVAQFIHLLLKNSQIRHVIDTVASKMVLILGRFTEERKAVLDALRTALRQRDYLPVLFDFERPSSRNITETVSTLAHMARFVIADITDAKSIPQELSFIVPHLPSVPVQPLLLKSQREYGMFEHFTSFPWVLPVALYDSQDELLGSLEQRVILPAEAKVEELRARTNSCV